MMFWTLQVILDLLLAGIGVAWILSRKRVEMIEAELALMRSRTLHPSQNVVPNKSHEGGVEPAVTLLGSTSLGVHPALENSNGNRISSSAATMARGADSNKTSLVERKWMKNEKFKRDEKAEIEAYDRADQMMARGMDLKEISRQTGLSLAELQLMGKVGNRIQ